MNTADYLPEGVKILIASAGAYLGAYLYQMSYAGYFGIPREFITVSTPNLLLFGATLVAVVVILFQCINILMTVESEHGEAIGKSAFGMVLKKWGITIAIGFSLWLFAGYQIEDIWRCWYLIVFVSLDLVLPMFRPKGVTYGDALREWISLDTKPKEKEVGTTGVLSDPNTKKLFFFLCLFVVAALYCLALGRGEARRRSQFGFIGNEAVIARYDDQLVMCEYDIKSAQFSSKFRLLDVGSAQQSFDIREIQRKK